MDACTLLLEEYRALRDEIMARAKSRFATAGFVGGLFAWALAQPTGMTLGMIVLCTLAIFALAALWVRQGHLIYACRRRLAMIEERLNTAAGEEAMAWHRLHHPPLAFDWLYRRLTNAPPTGGASLPDPHFFRQDAKTQTNVERPTSNAQH